MDGDEIPAIGYDCIGILHDLTTFEVIVVMQAHAFANDLKNIDNRERRVAMLMASRA